MRRWKPPEPDLFKAQALNILSLPLRKEALEAAQNNPQRDGVVSRPP